MLITSLVDYFVSWTLQKIMRLMTISIHMGHHSITNELVTLMDTKIMCSMFLYCAFKRPPATMQLYTMHVYMAAQCCEFDAM